MSDTKVTTYSIEPEWRAVLRFMDHALATGSVQRSKRAAFKLHRDSVAAYVAALDKAEAARLNARGERDEANAEGQRACDEWLAMREQSINENAEGGW